MALNSNELKFIIKLSRELFAMCDTEGKGFITKRDIQRLQTEVSLTPEQLGDVFDTLDATKDGYVTKDAFTKGFGQYLGISSSIALSSNTEMMENVYEFDDLSDEEDLDQEKMKSVLEKLSLNRDASTLREMWTWMSREKPELLDNFEEFLSRITAEIHHKQIERQQLEVSARRNTQSNEEEVNKIYEDMNREMDLKEEQILAEEKSKQRALRENMEKDLAEKDRLVQETLCKQQEMETQLRRLNVKEAAAKKENEKLVQEREELEKMLSQSQHNLEATKRQIRDLNDKDETANDRSDKTLALLQISDCIAVEHENLIKQLEMLRFINKKLQDDRDECELRLLTRPSSKGVLRRADAFEVVVDPVRGNGTKEFSVTSELTGSSVHNDSHTRKNPFSAQYSSDDQTDDVSKDYSGKDDDSDFPSFTNYAHKNEQVLSSEIEVVLASEREQPVGETKPSTPVQNTDLFAKGASSKRVFKVVCVGDSGVGKSSFLNRFCSNQFKPIFNTTIGIDYQVNTLLVQGQYVTLQLWDTAGQERFRSVTKQYFRKADGVLVMYDVTSELSFKNIRGWMASVQEGTEEGTVIALVGNKLDLVEESDHRAITTKDGARLAKDNGTLFFETSAKSGTGIQETLYAMASLLREIEDKEMEAVKISDKQAPRNIKKSCICS